MSKIIVGVCTIELHLPGLASLKEKRSILKSMLARIHNTFNVSAAEVDQNDRWQSAVIAIAMVSNSSSHTHQAIENILRWIETHYPEAMIVHQEIEIL